jgi:hypothetical protein
VRLFEHPDFEQAVLRAADHFRQRNLRPAIIEKDYTSPKPCELSAQRAAIRSFSKVARASQRDGTSLSAFRRTSTSSSITEHFSHRWERTPLTAK